MVFVTTGYRLVELNAKTGTPVQSFGRNGILALKEGAEIRGTVRAGRKSCSVWSEWPPPRPRR